MCVRCVNFLRTRVFHARVSLMNSYLVRMNNRFQYRDEAFEVFIIKSETWRQRKRERERERGREKEWRKKERKYLDATCKNFQSIAILIYKGCKIKIESKQLIAEIFIKCRFFKNCASLICNIFVIICAKILVYFIGLSRTFVRFF